MTPEEDLRRIRDSFSSSYTKKYQAGLSEHGGGLWTAGGGWFLKEAQNEAMDLWSYLFHAARCMDVCLEVAEKLRHGMITPTEAAKTLQEAAGHHRPNTFRKEKQTEKNNTQET